jgi:hypothetical protein
VPLLGTLIAESIRPGATLTGVDLRVHKITRADLGSVETGQPRRWTLLEFEAADDDADVLTQQLQDGLDSGSWFCDFRSESETFVVYADRAFRYPRGDRAGRALAANYGRTVGIPDHQLDWPE